MSKKFFCLILKSPIRDLFDAVEQIQNTTSISEVGFTSVPVTPFHRFFKSLFLRAIFTLINRN